MKWFSQFKRRTVLGMCKTRPPPNTILQGHRHCVLGFCITQNHCDWFKEIQTSRSIYHNNNWWVGLCKTTMNIMVLDFNPFSSGHHTTRTDNEPIKLHYWYCLLGLKFTSSKKQREERTIIKTGILFFQFWTTKRTYQNTHQRYAKIDSYISTASTDSHLMLTLK